MAGTFKLSYAIARLNSNIHFIPVLCTSTGKMFSRYPHIIPEKVGTLFKVLEVTLASSFVSSGCLGVVSGTCEIMKPTYPKNPDVLQAYNQSTVPFKGFVGDDFKNARDKLVPHGRNQIIIGKMNNI